MTYFGFLLRFLVLPLVILWGVVVWDGSRGLRLPPPLTNHPAGPVILLHALIALTYTTPWDNYLVATNVWWYDPELVSGITFGWVPLEEYTFFVLQPLLAGLIFLVLARRLPAAPQPVKPSAALRRGATVAGGLIWLASVALLLSRWQPGTYLALQLVWAVPPILLQLAFGADILWHHRRLVALTVGIATLYLAATDLLAIAAGTWTIDPEQTLHLLILGVLPLEEFTFFLLTNVLLVFGVTLAVAETSAHRVPAFLSTRLPWITGAAVGAHERVRQRVKGI
jgi:lycopene cyclase domain-containing protein